MQLLSSLSRNVRPILWLYSPSHASRKDNHLPCMLVVGGTGVVGEFFVGFSKLRPVAESFHSPGTDCKEITYEKSIVWVEGKRAKRRFGTDLYLQDQDFSPRFEQCVLFASILEPTLSLLLLHR
jgi:hypothetical protein